jgi:threonine/homoserine/homoserine lactone efflux protein
MNSLIEGVFLGLTLSIMIGPLLLALVSTSLEYGVRAGLMVGVGVWCSDVICFSAAYFGIGELLNVIENPNFEPIVGVGGGIILTVFGLGLIVGAKKKMKDTNAIDQGDLEIVAAEEVERKHPLSHMLKGALINAVNPFTVLFWAGTASTVLVGKSNQDAFLFFLGIMLTLITLDSAKVFMAAKIKHRIESGFILKFTLISGIAIIFFGIVMLIRVL